MPATEELNIRKLGIIAGGGDLPRQLLQFCKENSIEQTIIGIKNHVDHVSPDAVFRLGRAGAMLRFFKNNDVSDIVFIGSVTKPSLFNLWPDFRTLRFLLKNYKCFCGDDALLKAIRSALEAEGFNVRGIHQFLPELLMPEGILGEITVGSKFQADIQLGLKESQKLGQDDIGQAVIVKEGSVIAREDRKGTNAMIKKYGEEGAILVKTCKPQQDHDLDLPTLGLNTVKQCADKKMAGIVGHAGLSLTVDRKSMIERANKAGMFIMGVSIHE